ncbi:KH domain protein [Planoprotostelium fungivorum]|uniref:KH domain protein n=1 Tax=Planoprotostelium fungivorum TaxID=1890364 RepID=A0A2P6NXI0_9EUKA|nr:KH domain protein [Planoprotostelium fungivorum]
MADDNKKKRKWDVPAEDQPPALTPSVVPAEATAAIQQAAKRLNAMWSQPKDSEREFDINDLPLGVRQYLCKGTTHSEITHKTGAVLKVKGKHLSPGEQSDEKPLHLAISGNTGAEVDAAIDMLRDIVERDRNDHRPPRPISSHYEGGGRGRFGGGPVVNIPVTIPMESYPGIKGKLVGPGGSYVKHIVSTSGAQVQLRGRHSGYLEGPDQREADEPLHFMISAGTQEKAEHAKSLCMDLLTTLQSNPGRNQGAYRQDSGTQQSYGGHGGHQSYGQQAYGGYQANSYAQPYGYGGYQYPGYGYPQAYAGGYPYDATAAGADGAAAPGADGAAAQPVDPAYAAYYQEQYAAYYGYAQPAAEAQPSTEEPTTAAAAGTATSQEKDSRPPPPPAEDKRENEKRKVEKGPPAPKMLDMREDEKVLPVSREETKATPFWAAKTSVDESAVNPLKQDERKKSELAKLEADVLNFLD